MLKNEQSVEGDNNLQAGRDINQYGISYADAKEIALDIYRNELPYLTKLASDKACERVEPVLNEILVQIHQKKPEAINEFAEPEVQYMLGSAMKTASSTEDHVVHDTLVQLAVDHVLSKGKSYERIVDEQAIEVLQKMNREILTNLQQISFWNGTFPFVNSDNILTYPLKPFLFEKKEILLINKCIEEKALDTNMLTDSEVQHDNFDGSGELDGSNPQIDNLKLFDHESVLNRRLTVYDIRDNPMGEKFFPASTQIVISKIHEVYGMFFHLGAKEANQLVDFAFLNKDIGDKVKNKLKSLIMDIIDPSAEVKEVVFPFLCAYSWRHYLIGASYGIYANEHLTMDRKRYFKKIEQLIDTIFYNEDAILELYNRPDKNKRWPCNCDIFKYDLTQIGRQIVKYLPDLLESLPCEDTIG